MFSQVFLIGVWLGFSFLSCVVCLYITGGVAVNGVDLAGGLVRNPALNGDFGPFILIVSFFFPAIVFSVF